VHFIKELRSYLCTRIKVSSSTLSANFTRALHQITLSIPCTVTQALYPSTLSKHCIKASYPSTLSKHFIQALYPNTLFKHFVQALYPNTLSQHFINTLCQSTLSKHFIKSLQEDMCTRIKVLPHTLSNM